MKKFPIAFACHCGLYDLCVSLSLFQQQFVEIARKAGETNAELKKSIADA